MDKRLIPVNALVAMSRPTDGSWPTPFLDAGFQLSGLEVQARTEAGETLVDVVTVSDHDHLVNAEAKSGANLDSDQVRKLARVDAEQIVRTIGLTLRTGQPTCEPCLVGRQEWVDRLRTGLRGSGESMPVLVIGDSAITREEGEFDDDGLRAAFAEPVGVPGPPPAILTVDDQSPVREYVDLVRATLVECLAQGMPTVVASTVADRAIPYFGLIKSRRVRNAIVNRIESAAEQLCSEQEGWRFQRRTGPADAAIIFDASPEASDPRGRTQGYQAIGRRAQRGRRKQSSDPPGQMRIEELLKDLDAAEEDGDAE